MKRFCVRDWLEAGAPAVETAQLAASRPLDFDGVISLDREPLIQLVAAMGITSADALLDWVVPEELSLAVQEQLARAAERDLPTSEPEPPDQLDEIPHAIHPIAVVDNAVSEYRDHVLTEFRASDATLRQALEDALARPRFLAQDAFFQAQRPFKEGKRWDELGLDSRLAKVMARRARSAHSFLHQSRAIAALLGQKPQPVVVTTGTGSGKSECFLLPAIQNAIEDATSFKKHGLTAIIVYPMNALANDQEIRIRELLAESGHTYVRVERYDRSTTQEQRQAMRQHPPHILLTNYMMLEYLLTRPADRDALFSNHRCRYLVLDEVHTYRGTLGAHIALLVRRVGAHLRAARHDYVADAKDDPRRFPPLVHVATSATIKSVDERGRTAEEVRRLRDAAVQGFLGTLIGIPGERFMVLGEELRSIEAPKEASWPSKPSALDVPDHEDQDAVLGALVRLAGQADGAAMDVAARSAAVLWYLAQVLARRPMSVEQIADMVRADVPSRASSEPDDVRREVEVALSVGAALPPDLPGALRLRTHRFIRGGWRFHRCVDPACGRLYAMGQVTCDCGHAAAPLLLCRSCGADALQLHGPEDPCTGPMEPDRGDGAEWLLYDRARLALNVDDEELESSGLRVSQMRGRDVEEGTFDPTTMLFSRSDDYSMQVALAPARTKCLVCEATAGPGGVLTPVALGTSAAVRVLAEGLVEQLANENRDKVKHDDKERLLIFADSRQDAAHQARFITYAGRYDRMRRRLLQALQVSGGSLALEEAVNRLAAAGATHHDNPLIERGKDFDVLPKQLRQKAMAWEEAPLLDDLAVSARYRATVFNLGLVGVRYDGLDPWIDRYGEPLANRLGITRPQLGYVLRCLLDEMRMRSAVARPLLQYYPKNPNFPTELWFADWERRFATPNGYACVGGRPAGSVDRHTLPGGVSPHNFWRPTGGRGRAPGAQRKLGHLLGRMGGVVPKEGDMLAVVQALVDATQIEVAKLHGYKQPAELFQVSSNALVLEVVEDGARRKCSVCNVKMPWATLGSPCPVCHGSLQLWPDADVMQSRHARRLLDTNRLPLIAAEHTAQVPSGQRQDSEGNFKAGPEVSALNVLACSPTLEMGIDVGGLDAVVMRNIPPRPDNYAQRGGRAGRRSRVGVVLGYARSTPHDSYFYDKPREMIAGEVPAPAIGLSNRDVVVRHLAAIALGLADPGLAGRMVEYVGFDGKLVTEKIDAFVKGVSAVTARAARLALDSWGEDVLGPLGLGTEEALRTELERLPDRIMALFEGVQYQVLHLRDRLKNWAQAPGGDRGALKDKELLCRLLGIPPENSYVREEADDRSAGHPMRRFAEFGILPGYEFPTLPATLRLLGDPHEEEVLSTERRFGIGQYQPEAPVHARGHRWKVIGLDMASPWNPRTDEPDWIYVVCDGCQLRYGAQQAARCPRCSKAQGVAAALPSFQYGGFLASREDTPVLEEEDRWAMASRVRCFPQWDGDLVASYELAGGWFAELRHGERVRWLNEGGLLSAAEQERGAPQLHDNLQGFYLCNDCGHLLSDGAQANAKKGRGKAKKAGDDPYGHAPACKRLGEAPKPAAIGIELPATTWRLLVEVPAALSEEEYSAWGQSLGAALETGIKQLYMLDGREIDFVLEDMWEVIEDGVRRRRGALTFMDAAVGGSGFLDRASAELHLVAARALDHLDHADCDTACYRCLKSYSNQRFHKDLSWPRVMPDLELLASDPPRSLPVSDHERFDPRPWIDAYQAGVGSPLELTFLRLFETHGIEVEKQVPVSPEPGGRAISRADFVVKGKPIAIYIDSAAFHTGSNLRRDRAIRARLRSGSAGWTIIELQHGDLLHPETFLEKLR